MVYLYFFYPALNLSLEISHPFSTFFYATLLMHFLYKSSVDFSCDVYSQTVFQMNIIFATEFVSHTHACSQAGLLAHTDHGCI